MGLWRLGNRVRLSGRECRRDRVGRRDLLDPKCSLASGYVWESRKVSEYLPQWINPSHQEDPSGLENRENQEVPAVQPRQANLDNRIIGNHVCRILGVIRCKL